MTTRAPKTAPLSAESGKTLDDITRVFKEAVHEAREENRRLGIPNVQVDKQGRLTQEMPDGTIRLLEAPVPPQAPPLAKK